MLLLLAGLMMLTKGIRAATWRGEAKTSEDHPGQCIDESGQPHKVGTSWKPEKSCASITCGTGPNNTLQVQGMSCGVMVNIDDTEGKNCTLVENNNLPYPDCCHQEMKCEDPEDQLSQCIDESGQTHEEGTSWPSEKSCAMFTCSKGGMVVGKACGSSTLDYTTTNCRLESQDDLPYPDCCPALKCPSDKKSNDKGPLRFAAANLPNWPLESGNRRRNSPSSGMRRRNRRRRNRQRRNGPSSGMRRRNSASSGMRRRNGPSLGMRSRNGLSSGMRRRRRRRRRENKKSGAQ